FRILHHVGVPGVSTRAQHEGRNGRDATHHATRSRREDRRANAGAGGQRPVRHRGVPGEAALAVALLEVSTIDVFYGRVQAIRGLSISVGAGEIVALIGSNGAGKTTTLRTISGLMHPAGGKISFDGRDLTQTKAHEIVRIGICQSPEGRRLFPRMIVLDNLLMGTYARKERRGIQSDLAPR